MKRLKGLVACAGLALGMATTAVAHHSAVQFDFTKQVSYTGTVKVFSAINPHMRIVLDTKDANGKDIEVEFEGHSTNNMYRSGYRKGMINVGDKITVNAAPLRNGDAGGYVVSATTAKGEFFGMRSSRAAQAVAEGKAQAPDAAAEKAATPPAK